MKSCLRRYRGQFPRNIGNWRRNNVFLNKHTVECNIGYCRYTNGEQIGAVRPGDTTIYGMKRYGSVWTIDESVILEKGEN